MSDLNNREKFLATIASGNVCLGTLVTLADASVSESMAEAGYDFTWIDLEHTSLSLQSAQSHIMALRGTCTAPFVRVPWNDPVLLKPILEMVPAGIVVPMVCTPEEAARAAAACKYPPKGRRGFGPSRGVRYGAMPMSEYLSTADSETLVMVQIEHADALKMLEQIIETPGIDGICVGPWDLSGSMGKLGKMDDPEVIDAVIRILRATRRAGKLAGLATGFDPVAFRRWVDAGAQWISIATDCDLLFAEGSKVVSAARKLQPTAPRA